MVNQLPARASDPPHREGQRLSAQEQGRVSTAGACPLVRKLSAPLPPPVLGQLSVLPPQDSLPSTLDSLFKLHGGWGYALYRVDESGIPPTGQASDSVPPLSITLESVSVSGTLRDRFHQAADELLVLACESTARQAVEMASPVLAAAELAGQRCQVMALPVFEGKDLTACLCRVHPPGLRGESTALAGLQLAGLIRLLVQARIETRQIQSRFGKVAAFVELLGAAEGGDDFAECSRRLANHLKETLECDTVALAIRHFGRTRLAAVTGETGPAEAHSPGRRALLAHLSEAIHRRMPLMSRRTGGPADPENEGAVSLREWFNPERSLCLPLIDAQGKTRGAWLFLWSREPADYEEKLALIQAATPEVAPLLALLHRAKPGTAVGSVIRLWKRGSISQRRLATAAMVVLALAGIIPLPYPVRATGELQPVVRRVIAAPFDGILLRSSVRPGEVVKSGQLLAELEGREIRSQLADAVARRERSLKVADLALAEDRVADARMASLEAEGLGHEIDLLEYRREHLQVRSPIDGIILQGDLDRSEGAPLRTGDPLFEVGPLDQLVAELAVDATDIPLVSPGATVSLKWEADAHSTMTGEILRIAPRSEWVEDRNVFICEAEIGNPDGILRAGLKGKGKIEGPRRPLLWIWARDAWLALRYHLW